MHDGWREKASVWIFEVPSVPSYQTKEQLLFSPIIAVLQQVHAHHSTLNSYKWPLFHATLL